LDASLIAIVGPTGSGKSSLALALAERYQGEIVNCDSLQLYTGFDIGTAKPSAEARRDIPHHLFDVLEPQTSFSAGEYARQARQTIATIQARGRLPIVVGGTGFYLRALLDGIPVLPLRDEDLRTRLAAKEYVRPGALHRLLRRLEPAAAARIHAHDVHKLTRALEIRLLTKRPLPAPESAHPLRGQTVLQIGLSPDRLKLQNALESRTRRMFEQGLLDEVRTLLANGCTGAEKPFESLGYKQSLRYLRGELSLADAVESTIIETRQYAKRQWTWFRRDPRVHWIEGFGSDPQALEQAIRLTGFGRGMWGQAFRGC
jgi:tRNA dimethylallyltransferase